jgi:hypothetical protein
MSEVEICTNHTGKMEGIKSISTSVLLNKHCQKNRKILGSVCAHCYADSLAKMYTGLKDRLERNTKVLSEGVLGWEELPDVSGEEIFRLEAFGDLNNEYQMENYYNIVRKNPFVRFSLYTKQIGIVQNFFARTDIDLPPNLTIVFSSLFLNKKTNIESLELPRPYFKGQYKTFTVYSKNFLIKHPEVKINCGARCCNKCRRCYLKNDITEISEILKSDRESVERYFEMEDPKKREEILERVDNIIKKYL